ncbi:MAG: hypothetical protein ABIP88_09955, partial [Candidatus Binatia bacterium]
MLDLVPPDVGASVENIVASMAINLEASTKSSNHLVLWNVRVVRENCFPRNPIKPNDWSIKLPNSLGVIGSAQLLLRL